MRVSRPASQVEGVVSDKAAHGVSPAVLRQCRISTVSPPQFASSHHHDKPRPCQDGISSWDWHGCTCDDLCPQLEMFDMQVPSVGLTLSWELASGDSREPHCPRMAQAPNILSTKDLFLDLYKFP